MYRVCDYSQSLLIVRPLIRFGWKPQLPWWSSNRRNAEGLGAQKWYNYKQRSGVFPLPFYSPNDIDPFSTRVPWSRGLRSSRMWRRVTGYLVANCMSKSRAAITERRGDICQKKGDLKCAYKSHTSPFLYSAGKYGSILMLLSPRVIFRCILIINSWQHSFTMFLLYAFRRFLYAIIGV